MLGERVSETESRSTGQCWRGEGGVDNAAYWTGWQDGIEGESGRLAIILGHANIGTTLNLYVHPNLEQKQKCIKRMFRSLGG